MENGIIIGLSKLAAVLLFGVACDAIFKPQRLGGKTQDTPKIPEPFPEECYRRDNFLQSVSEPKKFDGPE